MAEREESFRSNHSAEETTAFFQTIPVNLEQLRQIEITNLNGRTHIVGTNRAEIMIKASSGSRFALRPSIEFKQDGSVIEIKALLGANKFDYDISVETDFDPDMIYAPPFRDFDAETFSRPWDFADEDEREAHRYARREEREARREAREHARQQQDQARHAQRQARETERQHRRRPWFNFDPALIDSLTSDISQKVSEAVSGMLGDLYIEVPAGLELSIKSVSGLAHISDITGLCRLNNTSGSIRLYRLSGGLQMRGLSGNLQAQQISGRVTAKVWGGNVRLSECNLSGLDLAVGGGNVQIETSLAEPEEGDFRINNSNGNVRLYLPRQARASVECRSLNGRIATPPEMGAQGYKARPGQSQLKFELNKGGRKIMLSTVNGNIELAFSTATGVDAPVPPTPPTTPSSWPATPPPPPPNPVRPMPAPAPAMEIEIDLELPHVPPAPPVPGFVPTYSPVQPGPLITPAPPVFWPHPTKGESDEQVATEDEVKTEAEAEKPIETAKQSRQLEILRAIERGELGVEEGLARLNGLDD